MSDWTMKNANRETLHSTSILKSWKWSPLRIWKCITLHDQLIDALDRAYLDAVTFLNEGDFKRKVVWDAGYIIDVLDKAKGIKRKISNPESECFDGREDDE